MIDMLNNDSFQILLAINVIAAIGMNLVYVTGQLNVGQAAFFAVGAYTTAVLDAEWGWSLWQALPAAALMAAAVATPIAIGANRVRGAYLIMGTMAAGEVVRVAISNIESLGGLQGYSGQRPIEVTAAYVTLLAVLVVAVAIMASPTGLRMRSIFDDEDAAAAAGVHTRRVKIAAVVMSAAIVGVAGGVMSKFLLFIAPRNFGITVSFNIALYTLLGGTHSLLGALVGAFAITYGLDVLRNVEDIGWIPGVFGWADTWRIVIYGLAVVAIMIRRPEGLISRRLGLWLTQPFSGLGEGWRSWATTWRTARSRASTPGPADPESSAPGPADPGPAESGAGGGSAGNAGTGQTAGRPPRAGGSPRASGSFAGPAGATSAVPALSVRGVSHRFGGLVALNDVDLEVAPGELIALIGANGAGKSTLINVIAGHYRCQQGAIELGGRSLVGLPAASRTRLGLARTFQQTRPFAHLTTAETLQLGSFASAGRDAPTTGELLETFQLADKKSQLPASLTLSQQRRIDIARAFASRPSVLFLDEPSVGFNAQERTELAALLRKLRASGTAIVLVDHNLDLALGVADRAVVLDFGSVIAAAEPREILNNQAVRAAYLGPTADKVELHDGEPRPEASAETSTEPSGDAPENRP